MLALTFGALFKQAALIFALEPVFAALFAFLLAGETLGLRGLLGGALILAGTIVAEIRRR